MTTDNVLTINYTQFKEIFPQKIRNTGRVSKRTKRRQRNAKNQQNVQDIMRYYLNRAINNNLINISKTVVGNCDKFSDNTSNVDNDEFKYTTDTHKFKFFVCTSCVPNLNKYQQCSKCTLFVTFKSSFNVQTPHSFYTFPQPCIWNNKNFAYFKAFIVNCDKYSTSKYGQYIYSPVEVERHYYDKWCKEPLRGGSLKTQLSGKYSVVRCQVLGYVIESVRGTLTIDSTLPPNRIELNSKMRECFLNRDTYGLLSLVFIKRDPSITARNLQIVEPHFYESSSDFTIHINSFIVRGMNADQDGDEVTLYFYKMPTFHLRSIILDQVECEIKNLYWCTGNRCSLFNRPRYEFGEMHLVILATLDNWFIEHDRLWSSIAKLYGKCSFRRRQNIILNLGCTRIVEPLFDNFLKLLLDVTHKYTFQPLTFDELINGTGRLETIVNAEIKGSQNHLSIYKDLINKPIEIEEFDRMSEENFNKYITSKNKMKRQGYHESNMRYGLHDLLLNGNNLIFNDVTLATDIYKSSFFAPWLYNIQSVNYLIDNLLNNLQ